MKKYETQILVLIGAQIHQARVAAPISNKVNDLKLKIIVNPSVTPVYYNNPSFSVLELDHDNEFKIKDLHYHFL